MKLEFVINPDKSRAYVKINGSIEFLIGADLFLDGYYNVLVNKGWPIGTFCMCPVNDLQIDNGLEGYRHPSFESAKAWIIRKIRTGEPIITLF